MFKRMGVMLLLVLAASIAVLPARAASAPWTAWLYEPQTGKMTQVDSTGSTLKQVQLPSQAAEAYSQSIAVSPDGLLVAYAGASTTTNNVYIFNLATNSNLFEFNVPQNANTSFEFSGSPLNFSKNNDTFAFGYVGMGIPWTLVVIDLDTLSASSLKQSDPAAASLPNTGAAFMPTVTFNRDNQISFMMIPYGTDGAPTYQAFTWNRDNNTIATNIAYVSPDTATFLPTNEVVSTISDDRYPGSRMQDTGFPVNNTLQVFDPKLGQRSIVALLPEIYNPRFIQAGERVALIHYDVLSDGNQTQSLLVAERDGGNTKVNGVPTVGINNVLGTQDGFIFSATSGGIDPKSNGTNVYYVETRAANGAYNAVSMWSSALGTNARLVWVNEPATTTTTFKPWGHIDAPSVTPTPIVGDGGTSNGVPVGDSAYQVGIQARVQTTNNDVLNMRSGPGTTFQRVGTIGNGVIVTLIEGPQNADGFIWWRVRLSNGSEGWVVSQADGINTLIPQ